MAITTGATDVGSSRVEVGSRARAGGQQNGDDSFANALDSQMKSPRNEASRTAPKRESEKKTDASAEKSDSAENSAPTKESSAAKEAKGADSNKKAESSDDSSSSTDQNAAQPVADQSQPSTDAVSGTPEGIAALLQTGNSLPQAATTGVESTTITADGSTVTTAAEGTTTASKSSSTAFASLKSGTATDSQRSTSGSASTRADLATLEASTDKGTAAQVEGAAIKQDVANAPGAAPKNTDSLLQAMRMSLSGGQGQTAKGETSDNFSAMLESVREANARNGDVAATQSTSPAALISQPAATTNGNPAVSTTATSAAQAPITVPVGERGWDHAVGERVVWMTNNGLKEAKIELHPRELGPIEVRVSVLQDQASVAFTAHTPAAREALESAMPRLREMMAESGLTLAQSDVSQQSPQQQQGNSADGNQSSRSGFAQGGTLQEESATVIGETALPKADGAVDYYA